MGRVSKYSLHRKTEFRLPRRRFYLFCEGKNTEPGYFAALKWIYRRADIFVEIVGGVGDPGEISKIAEEKMVDLGLVPRARTKSKNSFEARDEVWVVFDRDEHVRFDEGIERCERVGVRVARSNPCFEVWLILHFTEYNRACDRFQVQDDLRKHCPKYNPNKGKTFEFSQILERVELAEERAERQCLLRRGERKPFGPPSTTVYNLTRAIRAAAADSI